MLCLVQLSIVKQVSIIVRLGSSSTTTFYIVYGNIPVRLTKFEINFTTKRNVYFVTQFMSKRNFLF